MKDYGVCDLEYRPADYWSGVEHVFANVKGQWRREKIRKRFEEGEDGEIPEELLADSLPPEARLYAGAIHPQLMGGEYLPDNDAGEVEIARVAMKSVTGDIQVFTARRRNGKLEYHHKDEYGRKTRFWVPGQDTPLSLRQLILVIEGVPGYFWCERGVVLNDLYCREVLVFNDLEEYREFTRNHSEVYLMGLHEIGRFYRVSSPFYPGLEEWYDCAIEELVAHLERAEVEPEFIPVYGESPKFMRYRVLDRGYLGYAQPTEDRLAKRRGNRPRKRDRDPGLLPTKTTDLIGHVLSHC